MKKHLLIQDQFSAQAQVLRKTFDQRFADTSSLDSKRFVWDYWHVPDQYTLVRTPAYHYFPEKEYLQFHKELLFWGRKNLGCWDISPPWLSYYVDGCKQELHSDVPHGPWAFVFSLTPEKRQFQGGETLILKPQTLAYWNNFNTTQDRELKSFVDRVPAKFNRLTVFDPRFPHGVTEVRGTHDPRQARLVIHGWFTEPKTYVKGPLSEKACEKKLNQAFDQVNELISYFPATQGVLSLQMKVAANGKVTQAAFATNTLVHINGENPSRLTNAILKIYKTTEFPSARGSTEITVPLIFS